MIMERKEAKELSRMGNMKPRIADYNIILNGNYSNENIIGNWHLYVWRGSNDEVSGSFEINNENEYTAFIKE